MSEPVLELTNINKSFTGNRVLCGVSLKVYPGEIFSLVGENGSGKSTLIKIVSGVYQADSGTIRLNGKDYDKLDAVTSIREGVQVIYQDFSVFHNLTVAENISLGTQLVSGSKIMRWKQAREQAAKALEYVGVSLDLDTEVGRLSVSQKQIVAIARAVLQDAKIIIMDEPTTALTNREIDRLYEIIRSLSQKGIAVIFVSHKLDEIYCVSQRIAVIRNGLMVVDQPCEEFDRDRMVYYMTGQEIGVEPFIYEPISDIPTLKVENLSQRGSFEDISFEMFPGEILGITGQLGSGRTELAEVLFGIGKPTSGRLLLHGVEAKFKNIREAMEKRIAYVPEDRLSEGLFMERDLVDNINAPTIDRKKDRTGLVNIKKMMAEAVKRIQDLSINAKSINQLANTFSGGNQQRIVIAKWLASDPEILILNGPTVGVDVKSKNDIHCILRDLAHEGLCIILISNDIGELLTTTNRILVMNNGQLVYESKTEDADEETLNEKILMGSIEEEIA